MLDGTQKGLGGVPAHPVFLVYVEVATALVVAAIEVVDLGNAGFGGGGAEGVEDLPADTRQLHAPLAAAGVHLLEGARRQRLGVEGPLVLVPFEIGQHV